MPGLGQQAPAKPDPWASAYTPPAPPTVDPRVSLATTSMRDAVTNGSFKVANDSDAGDYAQEQADAFKSSVKEKFPQVDADAAGNAFRDELKEHLRGQLLVQHAQQHVNYLNSGYFPGRRSTWQDVGMATPILNVPIGIAQAKQINEAAERMANGEANGSDYQVLGEHLGRQMYDSKLSGVSGGAQKLFDMGQRMAPFVAEWMMLAGPAKAVGGAAEASVSRLGAGAVTAAISKYGAAGAARTVLRPDKIAELTLQHMAPHVSLDEQGRVQVAQGDSGVTAVRKAALSEMFTNTLFEGVGFLGAKPGPFSLAKVAGGTAKVVGAAEASQELSGWAGGGGSGGFTTRMAQAKNGEERQRVLEDGLVELAGFGLLEAGMGGAGHIDWARDAARESSQKFVDSQQKAGKSLDDAQQSAAQTIQRIYGRLQAKQPPGEPPAPATAQPSPKPPGPPAPADVASLEAQHSDATKRLSDELGAGRHDSPEAAKARSDLMDAGRGLQAARTAAPPEPPESPQVAPEPKAEPTAAPEGEVPPKAKPGEATDWHREYTRIRSENPSMNHENAAAWADLHVPEGQSWVHSGTKFEGEGKNEFVDSEGNRRSIGADFVDKEGIKTERLWIPDAEGETAHVVLFQHADGTYHGEMLKSDVPGHARALYDYATEAGRKIVPSKKGQGLGQSEGGSKLWKSNAEASLKPKGEAPKPVARDPKWQADFDAVDKEYADARLEERNKPPAPAAPPESAPEPAGKIDDAELARNQMIGKGGAPAFARLVDGSITPISNASAFDGEYLIPGGDSVESRLITEWLDRNQNVIWSRPKPSKPPVVSPEPAPEPAKPSLAERLLTKGRAAVGQPVGSKDVRNARSRIPQRPLCDEDASAACHAEIHRPRPNQRRNRNAQQREPGERPPHLPAVARGGPLPRRRGPGGVSAA